MAGEMDVALLMEVDRLLCIARDAASKLFVMYERGEADRKCELDELIAEEESVRAAIARVRELWCNQPAAGGEK